MTCREKYALDFPVDPEILEGMCPHHYRYLAAPYSCKGPKASKNCEECWNREIPEDKVTWGEEEIHRNMGIPQCYTDGTEKIAGGEPKAYGEKVINEPKQVAQLKVIGDKEPECVDSYTTHTGNIDKCFNCFYRSPYTEFFNEDTKECIALAKGEKVCTKYSKIIVGNVIQCDHHITEEEVEAADEETATRYSDTVKKMRELEERLFSKGIWQCKDCLYMSIVNDKAMCCHVSIDRPCGDTVSCTNYTKINNDDSVKVTVRTGMIKDSGARREFATGAVRDIQEGKGRCDLLPLDVVAHYLGEPEVNDAVLYNIVRFTKSGEPNRLLQALESLAPHWDDGKSKVSTNQIITQRRCSMILEVSKHFEEGAKKYGEYNWQKGIPTHCYIDSAVRHYLKYLRGDKDEPHDRAFVWNILCCIWTCIHKPELNDYSKENKEVKT